MDAWIDGLKDREMNLFKPGYFFGENSLWFIAGSFVFFLLFYTLFISSVLIKCYLEFSFSVNNEHFHPFTTGFISLQNGFVAGVNKVYFLLERIIISVLSF